MTPLLLFIFLLLSCAPAAAQRIEISPFGGYRFGWSVSDVNGVPVVDDDGGPSVGVVANVLMGRPEDGFKFEALFSRERAWVTVQSTSIFAEPARARVTVDQMMVGVSQELEDAWDQPVRAFISGLVGLTRYAAADDYEVRFAVGLAAGGKFFASRHVGVRIEGRGFMTIIDLGGTAACSGGCVFAFRANPVFQADLTAGLILAF